MGSTRRPRHRPTSASRRRSATSFASVNVARRLNVDPELELRRASDRFVERVERAEQLAGQAGERFADLELESQDRYFDLAKEEL